MRELSDYLAIARRRWPVLLAGLVLGIALAAFSAQSTPKSYSATSTVYVSMATGTSVADSYQGGLAAQQRVRSYLELVGSDFVLDRVIGQLGLGLTRDELRGMVSVDSPPATALLRITVTDTEAERSRLLTDETVSQFRALVAELETIEDTAAPQARVAVVDRAERPAASGGGSTKLLALGAVGGLVLGGGVALLLELFDRRVRTGAELAPLGRPLLGSVALGTASERDDLRALRSRLPEATKTVLLTGIGARSEPALAIGLAGALAATGSRVLLIDADTTRTGSSALLPAPEIDWPVRTGAPQPQPDLALVGAGEAPENAAQQTTKLDLRNIPGNPPADKPQPEKLPASVAAAWHTGGLAALLRGDGSVEDAVTPWPGGNFAVLPLGAADGQTADLLASGRFVAVLRAAREKYDHVLIDAAAPGDSADAVALASRAASTIGVVVLGDARTDRAEAALATLTAAGATVTGLVTVNTGRNWWQRLSRRSPRRTAPAVEPGPEQ
ncbi:protein tyrosine kinase [Nocardia jiangsuensis]|uniref:Protein tyrosine kinase n=1 Tax=Nocardia jiangsuensis TaxID=1691563 RepID=A0ABV8E213_9NOCA